MSDTAQTFTGSIDRAAAPARVRDYIDLLKPRVMSLVVFTGWIGVLIAPVHLHSLKAALAVLAITLGSGAAGAINMWYERDLDALMARTRNRPLPAGRVAPDDALGLGVLLSIFSVLLMALSTNFVAAALLAAAILFYVFVYTIWLKRRTPQNIVIGGAAGAFPPMIGWAVATGGVSIESALMFGLIFMWTPPHFWALALFMKGDYHTAGVPMLTVTHGRRETRRQILIYTVLLAPVSIWSALTSIGGPFTLATAVVLNALFLKGAYDIWKRAEETAEGDKYAVEKKVFKFSLAYLFLHFAAFLIEALLKTYGLGGWA